MSVRILLAGLLWALPLGAQEPLRPDRVIPGGDAPRVVHLAAPGSPAVSVRLSVPLREAPIEAGAASLLGELARERMAARLRPVGAESDVERTPRGLAYTVTGAREHLELLMDALREAAEEPEPAPLELIRARQAALGVLFRSAETARGVLHGVLRDRIAPGLPPLPGTEQVLDTLDAGDLRRFWRRTHATAGMTAVVSGDVSPEAVARSLRMVGAPPGSGGEAPTEGGRRAPDTRPEVLRDWYAEAWAAGSPEDPRGAVVAALAAERLGSGADPFAEIGVEVWVIEGRNVLVVAGAAYPNAPGDLRRRVASVLPVLAGSLEADEVARAASAVRRQALFRARTPAGRVDLVGRALDATGDPEAAWRFVRSLDRVGGREVAAFLEEVLSRTPVRYGLEP